MDGRLLAFTLGVSLLTAVLFGLFPALSASRTGLTATFNEGSVRAGSGMRHNRARAAFVVTEVALAVVLLVGSGLLIRTVVALGDVDPGFDAHNVLVLRTFLTGQRFSTTAATVQAIRGAVRRAEAVPGVEKASAACCVPLQGSYWLPFTIAGRPTTDVRDEPSGPWETVSPGYFDVFKIELLRGRTFNEHDDAHGPPVVIINEALARRYWPEGGALGARITIGHGVMKEFEDEPARRIVGIVADTRDRGLNQEPLPRLYEPLAQTPDAENVLFSNQSPVAWVVRTRTSAVDLREPIQAAIRQATGLPVSDISSMDQVVQSSTSRQRFNMWVMTVFGACALLLAAIGIYGVMAYTVEQRTSEIGIRRALGAGQANVKNMVVWQGMRLVLVGVLVGIAAALALSRLIAAFLYGVQSWDPLVFVSVPLVLAAVALVALWWPARRASRVDPSLAMRSE
jgi:predicted permease